MDGYGDLVHAFRLDLHGKTRSPFPVDTRAMSYVYCSLSRDEALVVLNQRLMQAAWGHCREGRVVVVIETGVILPCAHPLEARFTLACAAGDRLGSTVAPGALF